MPFTSGLLREDALVIEGTHARAQLRLPWMRSLPWEAIAGLSIRVNGEAIPQDELSLAYGGDDIDPSRIQDQSGYWMIGTAVDARFQLPNRPAPTYEVEAEVIVEAPYIPGPGGGPLTLPMTARREFVLETQPPL